MTEQKKCPNGCDNKHVCSSCACSNCKALNFETMKCDCPVSHPEVPKWINKFLVAGSQNNCGDLSIMVSTVSSIIQEVREATLEEAVAALEGFKYRTSAHEAEQKRRDTVNQTFSFSQSTIRSLKTKQNE